MKYLKSVVGATTTLGALGLSMPATANVYNANFALLEVHGEKGANTSSSLAGASLMAERGMSGTYEGFFIPNKTADPQHSGIPSFAPEQFTWEGALINGCAIETLNLGGTAWPAKCNPIGMANYLNGADPLASWSVFKENTGQPLVGQQDLLNKMATSLFLYGSPGATPIYGQADHFVNLFQITATPVTGSPGQYTVTQALVYDGGGLGPDYQNHPLFDSSTLHKFQQGLQTYTGFNFSQNIFQVVTAISPACDAQPGTCMDPFFHNFVLLFDPPRNSTASLKTNWVKAPGIEPRGAMNLEKAQHRVWDALVAADINSQPESWDAISGAVAGQPVLVNAVLPDGSAWNYYLVPLLTSATSVAGFAQLSADDGAFEHLSVFNEPLPYTAPVTKEKAKQLARGALNPGDRLTTDGVLTFAPATDSELARTPNAPYYEFGVIDAHGKSNTARVTLHDGTAIRGKVREGRIVKGH